MIQGRGEKVHTDSGVLASGSEGLGERGVRSTVEDDTGDGVVHVRHRAGNDGGCESREDGNDGELHFAG